MVIPEQEKNMGERETPIGAVAAILMVTNYVI